MRILYVEDEKFLAEAVIHLLKKAKIGVDWTADGEEGLELALKPGYDAIVLDIMLPKISGLEILAAIRKRNIKTPVIIFFIREKELIAAPPLSVFCNPSYRGNRACGILWNIPRACCPSGRFCL